MLGNHGAHASIIRDRLYELMEKSKFIRGIDRYSAELLETIGDYIEHTFPYVEWTAFEANGIAALSWVENGHLFTESWDVVQEGEY